MKDDIFESVSQRGSGEETAENRRIHEVADELRRRCQLYEAQFRDGQNDVNRLEVEQRVAEQYAKENGIWIPMSDVFELGVPGPSGNENDTYVSNDIIYKVNNLLNSGSILRLLPCSSILPTEHRPRPSGPSTVRCSNPFWKVTCRVCARRLPCSLTACCGPRWTAWPLPG